MKSKYWYERQFKELQYLSFDEISEEMEATLFKEYQRVFYKLKADMLSLLAEIKNGSERPDGAILASDFYKYQGYYELMNKIEMELVKLGIKEKAVMEQGLTEMYNRSLTETSRLISTSIKYDDKSTYGIQLISANESRAKQIISEIWCADGKTWAQRIGVSTVEFKDALQESLIDCAVRGLSSKNVAKELNKVLGEDLYKTQRLVRTELAHVQNVAAVESYRDAGIEYYTVLTEGSDTVCPICQEFEGKQFSINEPCVIPAHPNCRCTTLAILR